MVDERRWSVLSSLAQVVLDTADGEICSRLCFLLYHDSFGDHLLQSRMKELELENKTNSHLKGTRWNQSRNIKKCTLSIVQSCKTSL